jgi:diguanylate cyclase (GGDEF)-like protein
MAIVHARRNASDMAVVYLDLDGFKQINDTLGHGVGDVLLKMVAARLVATVREEDTVARVGGDEFIIVLWHVSNAENTTRIVAKVIDVISQPFLIEGQLVHVTTSAGISIYPAHGEDTDTLMKNADTALFAAKHAGKNMLRIWQHPDLVLPDEIQNDVLASNTSLTDAIAEMENEGGSVGK